MKAINWSKWDGMTRKDFAQVRRDKERERERAHRRERNVVVNDNETTKHTERQNYRFDNNGQWWINERTERDENSSIGTKQQNKLKRVKKTTNHK